MIQTRSNVRLKLPPSVAICPSDGGELTTDGQTLKCRHCSGDSLLGEWNRKVARFVREARRPAVVGWPE